ncbi:MAG: DUF3990 domain-containing protein [Lachnospiraceae bacterium]
MYLYHGSNLSIETIDLDRCRPYKDFGKGFYLTEMKEQALKMAYRVSTIYGGTPIVNVYEISESIYDEKELNIRKFGSNPSPEWAVFVMNNRSHEFRKMKSEEHNLDNKYDIVVGAIADDDMAVLFRQYQNEWIDFDALLRGLTFKSATNQYSFHTQKALEYIQKIGEFHG